MVKLYFEGKEVASLVAETRANTKFKTMFNEATGPGLWLVKDAGAYLISNGVKRDVKSVAYAEGCEDYDGEVLADLEDDLGGDDWAEFFPLAEFEQAGPSKDVAIILTKTAMRVAIIARRHNRVLSELRKPGQTL